MRAIHMDTVLRFLVTKDTKERLWRLSTERGLLPSQVMRQALASELERLERERDPLATLGDGHQ